ncbi:MAG: general secretion pathway protein GspE [Deltaproteobacteria bacterium]|nr:general secretion pathway protein GspE [Deltaproteobacteria bacterium]
MKPIGELLIEDGVCTPQQIEDAVRNQVIMGGRLGTNLVELGFVDEPTLARYLGRQHDRPSLHGDQIQPDREALALLSTEAVERLTVIPFVKESRRLQVLCIDPTDLASLDEVRFATGLEPDPIVVPEIRFWQLLERLYGIERRLRFVAINTADFMAPVLAADASAPSAPVIEEDLVSEEAFDRLYQRRDGFPELDRPPLPSEAMPLLDVEDLEEVIEEPEPAGPPGGIERRVWQEDGGSLRRRAEDAEAVERAGAPPSRPPEPLEGGPLGFREASALLDQVTDRNAIARCVLRFARSIFARSMLFTVHSRAGAGQAGVVLGWDALGADFDRWGFRSIMVPLNGPSVFKTVIDTRAHYLGGLQKTPINIQFLRVMGKQVPRSAFVMPVLVRGRVVNVFYADNGHKAHCPSDIGELLILAQRISQSYEALFQKKRAEYRARQQPGGS